MNLDNLIIELQKLQAQGHGNAPVSYEALEQRRMVAGQLCRGYRYIQSVALAKGGATVRLNMAEDGGEG